MLNATDKKQRPHVERRQALFFVACEQRNAGCASPMQAYAGEVVATRITCMHRYTDQLRLLDFTSNIIHHYRHSNRDIHTFLLRLFRYCYYSRAQQSYVTCCC